jgi:hypothetical protein
LTSKFEEDRRQILGGCSRDDFSRAGAAGKENEVEGKVEQLRRLFAVAGHCCHSVRLEILRHQLDQ